MKVVVIPKRPIPGILPKNKWISEKTVLDLNKNEIKHCMQFGNVYDEKGNLIDAISIKALPFVEKPVVEEVVEPIAVEPVTVASTGYIAPVVEEVKEPEVVLTTTKTITVDEPIPVAVISEEVVEPIVEEIEETRYYELKPTYSKEDNYIILEAEVKSNTKLEGNLYGLFSVTSGTKPSSMEFNVNGEWFKFTNKFANFTDIENGAKLAFRFVPKNENEFAYRILIKEANTELVRLEGKVNPAEL